MAFVRSIGRWTMTALVINCIIGSGIFALPGELSRLVGRASPIAMFAGALVMGIIMACLAEVASQFCDPGGPYLYARAAFGRFIGMQVGWVVLLSVIVGAATLSSFFVDALGLLLPWPPTSWERALFLAVVIAIPTTANYRGVRSGARLNNVTTASKILPLALLIAIGVPHIAHNARIISVSEISSPGISNWIRALMFLAFAYGGWENSLVATGEIAQPRRTIPFGLGTGLLICAAIYVLIQFVTIATIGLEPSPMPLQETGSLLLGAIGGKLVDLAILISTYSWVAGAMLYGPRAVYALAAGGDFPALFARVHPRFHTPSTAIVFYALTAWVLASAANFSWLLALSAGTIITSYVVPCAALWRLRQLWPHADAVRIPLGRALSIVAVAIALALLTGLRLTEIFLMGVTALVACVNWWWVTRHRTTPVDRGIRGTAAQ